MSIPPGCCSPSQALSNTIGQCSWTECEGSCPSGTTLLTKTLTGDGGDSPCTSGWRSLCCPTSGGSGFISSTCQWYQNAFHATCTPGCPQGKVQLATDSAGAHCVRGFGSFCCDPPINTLAGRSDPQMLDFERFVHAFMTAGTCAANPSGSIPRRQLSLINPSSHDMAMRLAPLLYDYVWSSSERPYIKPFQETWDEERGTHGNVFPSFDTLAKGLSAYNPIDGDSVGYLDDVLCYGKFGNDAINSQASASSHLCVEVGGLVAKRGSVVDFVDRQHVRWEGRFPTSDITSNKTIAKRWFMANWEQGSSSTYRIPTTGDALDLAATGTLRPEFFNFFRYQGNQIEMEGKKIPSAEDVPEY